MFELEAMIRVLQLSVIGTWSILLTFQIDRRRMKGGGCVDPAAGKSIMGNDYDCDHNECRDQRKSAIQRL
jgi:hypothetical protein